MGYTQTSEYAFDLLEHFYNIHKEQIDLVGKDNIEIYVPTEIYELLAFKEYKSDKIKYPKAYRKMPIHRWDCGCLIFALIEPKRGVVEHVDTNTLSDNIEY